MTMREGLLVLLFALLVAFFSILAIVSLPRVWRGERLQALPLTSTELTVTHRGFPSFVLMVVCLLIGGLLIGLETLTGYDPIGALGIALLVLAVPCFVVWLTVEAFNRPQFFVPPPRRDDPGWVGVWQEGRRRRRRREPPTDHLVHIYDVRPAPGERNPYAPYFVAICEDSDCDWMSDPVARGAEHPDPEQTVRRQASEHTTTVADEIQRPVG